jgi:predicted aconitase
LFLTNSEEKALAGEQGEALEIAYRVLVAIGKISNAKKLIPIKWAHVSGVSYLTIGEYGLDFLKKISSTRGTKFRVFTTVNPCGMDIENWDSLNFSPEYANKQLKIISYYEFCELYTRSKDKQGERGECSGMCFNRKDSLF